MQLSPIGVIHSTYQTRNDAPRQGRLSAEKQEIEIYPEYTKGLQGMEDVTHLIVLYWLHQARRDNLLSRPPINPVPRGVFTARSPNRPNPIGFAVAEILHIEGNKIIVTGLDAINGTPLIDMKPYSPGIDCVSEAEVAWMKEKEKNR